MEINDPINLKAYAKEMLQQTDWVALSDVDFVNKDEFLAFRSTMRFMYLNPITPCGVPDMPEPVWVEPEVE